MQGFRVVAEVVQHHLFLTGVAPGFFHRRLVQVFLVGLNIVGPPDFGQQQPQTHPAPGDGAVFVLALVVGFCLAFLALGVFQLFPDGVEFLIDHGFGNLEFVVVGKPVQQVAFHPHPRKFADLAQLFFADRILQRLKGFQAGLLGQFVVNRRRRAFLDFMDFDREHRLLTGQVLGPIFLRERHLDGKLGARLVAGQLGLEAGNEAVRTQFQRIARGGAAIEGLVIDVADKIDEQRVAVRRRAVVGDRGHGLVGGGQAFQGFQQARLVGFHHQTFQLQLGKIGGLDVGHDFEGQVVFQVAPFVERGDFDLRLQGRAQAVVRQGLGRGFVDRLFQNLAHHRWPVALAQQTQRHLARAETGQPGGGGDFGNARGHLGLDFSGQHLHREFAL